MLVLSREIGQAFVIEDVLITVEQITADFVDVTLQKITGGEKRSATLPLNEPVEVCYNAELIYITDSGLKARIGIEAPPDVNISREEM